MVGLFIGSPGTAHEDEMHELTQHNEKSAWCAVSAQRMMPLLLSYLGAERVEWLESSGIVQPRLGVVSIMKSQEDCYGLNCVRLKFQWGSTNSQWVCI